MTRFPPPTHPLHATALQRSRDIILYYNMMTCIVECTALKFRLEVFHLCDRIIYIGIIGTLTNTGLMTSSRKSRSRHIHRNFVGSREERTLLIFELRGATIRIDCLKLNVTAVRQEDAFYFDIIYTSLHNNYYNILLQPLRVVPNQNTTRE